MVKVGIKMQSFSCVLSQRLVSVLFIAAVLTHMENSKFFLALVQMDFTVLQSIFLSPLKHFKYLKYIT